MERRYILKAMDIKQKEINKQYQDYVNSIIPKSNIVKNCIMAFIVGGIICTIGQAISNLAKNYYQLSQEEAGAFTSIIMIFFSIFVDWIRYL